MVDGGIAVLGETLAGQFERQLLASLLLVLGFLLSMWLLRRLRGRVRERYDPEIAEIVHLGGLAGVVLAGSYLLAAIWGLTWVFRFLAQTVPPDEWTAIQQVGTAVILVTAYLLIRVINRSFDRLEDEGAITKHQMEVAYHVADAAIGVAAAVVVLSLWGIDLTNLFIGAGVASAVLGLAAQKTVAAVIAGFVLLFARPFRAGDWVGITREDGTERSGIVQDVTISHTKIRTFNDEHVLVPNDEITSNQLTNYSRSDRLRIDVEVGVDFETDLGRACEVVREAAEESDPVADTPSPEVVLKRFDDSAIVLELQFWIDRPARRRAWRARTAVIRAVKAAFDREGITIPFPQRTHEPRGEDGFRIDSLPDDLAERVARAPDVDAE